MKKMMSIFLTISLMCISFCSVVYADSISTIENKVSTLVNAVSYIGYAVAVGMFLFVGIKYAMAPANEKADVKQASVNYLIGAFLIVCASGVATVFAQIAVGADSETTGNLATEIVNAFM